MENNVDEDLIEATIRRVAAQKAGGQSGGAEARRDDESPRPQTAQEHEDQVEETIRRVAAQKAVLQAHAQTLESNRAPVSEPEDAIEATIRRVAAQKAAMDAAAPADGTLTDAGAGTDDAIEATIRRVAEQKAAMDAAAPTAGTLADAGGGTEDAIEATIRRVAAQKAAMDADASPVAAKVADDVGGTDAIEATILRVAAQKAAMDAAPEAASVEAEPDDAIEETIRRVQAEKSARESSDAEMSPPPAPLAAPQPARPSLREFAPPSYYEPGPPPADSPWSKRLSAVASTADLASGDDDAGAGDRLTRIERTVEETAAAVAQVAADLKVLMSLVERSVGSPAPVSIRRDPPSPSTDDDWDDTPVIPRLSGMPPRPSVLRDPSPQTATAQHLEPAPIDNRPLPKPLPPIQAEAPRRGFDLLPRSYRITVEDKRRGVDLVPLHRALLGMSGVNDMSLLSYNNGVAIVALDTTTDLDPEVLRACIARAMSRDAKVEVHNEHTMVVKLAED